jgi:hypothetical protein
MAYPSEFKLLALTKISSFLYLRRLTKCIKPAAWYAIRNLLHIYFPEVQYEHLS